MKWRGIVWITLLMALWAPLPLFAFPPQSIEFAPGYKFSDSASDGAIAYQFRYFLYPSPYLGVGLGVGSINAKANNDNLAVNSRLKMNPVAFILKFVPPHPPSIIPFFEAGIDHFAGFHYQLDPTVDTGAGDFCTDDISAGPQPCKTTAFKKSHYGYHVGAGFEVLVTPKVGIGLHYIYLFAKPLERRIDTTPDFGITPDSSLNQDIFKINVSILSLLLTYHFN